MSYVRDPVVLSAALAGVLSVLGMGLGEVMGVTVLLHLVAWAFGRKVWQVAPV